MKRLLFILSFASLTIIVNAQWQQTSLDSGDVSCLTTSSNDIFAGIFLGLQYKSSNNCQNKCDNITEANLISNLSYNNKYSKSISEITDHIVYKTTDNGLNWSAADSGLLQTNLYSFMVCGTNIFTGTHAGVYLSSDNGISWDTARNGIPSSPYMAIFAMTSYGTDIFAGVYNLWPTHNGIYLSTDTGKNWTAKNNGLTGTDTTVYSFAISGSKIFAGLHHGVFLSTDTGNSWTTVSSGLNNHAVWALAINGNSIFAGTNYGIYKSINDGATWSVSNNGLIHDTTNAFIVHGTNIFAGTNNGVFISKDDGNNWIAVNSGLIDSTYHGYITSLAIKGDTIYAGTWGQGVWKRSLSQMTGIEELKNNASNISVYPNPATNNFTIESLQKATIEILNTQGQTIFQQQLQQGKSDIDISGLAKGVYIVRLKSNDKTAVTRIVKE